MIFYVPIMLDITLGRTEIKHSHLNVIHLCTFYASIRHKLPSNETFILILDLIDFVIQNLVSILLVKIR